MNFHRSTLRTIFGYSFTLLEKFFGVGPRGEKLESIFNYLPINAKLSTSGQPTAKQFTTIANSGFKLVINLAPHSAENALKNEADIVTRLGMQYINIPVDFDNPRQQDFDQFVACMKNFATETIWVDCAANMRASCFTFLYRTSILGESPQHAEVDLKKIWEPFGAWRGLITSKITNTDNRN
jgi:protein tyrosine phosphatase (PTP) superfamily phosphohydrolase (DUF442 family)